MLVQATLVKVGLITNSTFVSDPLLLRTLKNECKKISFIVLVYNFLMNLHMLLQVRQRSEGSIALAADMGLLSSVNSLMSF